LTSGIPFVSPLIHEDTSGPTVVPDANNFEHVTTLKTKFVCGSRLIGPQNGNTVAWVNIVLRVVVFEEWQLL
jgi:hypothetical protein